MNIKCSELDNINVSLDYCNSMKLIGDELIKYLKGYNQLSQEYIKKLQIFQQNFGKKLIKSENPKCSQLLTITSKIDDIISQNIELMQISVDDIDSRIKNLEILLKEKIENANSFKKTSFDLIKDLNSSYNEINKTKNNFLSSISKAEEVIDKYNIDKNKIQEHENGLGIKLSENEYNSLKEQQKNELGEMNNLIKMTKKYEDFHKGSISASIKMHDKFIEDCNSYRDKIKLCACEIADEIKNLVCAFFVCFKNSYKQPLSSIEIFINDFNLINEQKEIDKIISSDFKTDNQLKNFESAKYQLKSFSLLSNWNYLKNQENENNNEENDNNQISNKRKLVEKLEDGFSEMKYICDESLVMTIKSMFENFDLIDKEGFDIQFEEGKNKAQKYVLKIISNMNSYPFAKEGLYANNNLELLKEYTIEYKREELTNEEIMDLIQLLNVHENRIIFLQKLSDYRARGKFVLCDKDYILLSQLFNIISDKIQKDNDYHTAEMVIILSETYFIEEGKRKKFLQESFKGNKVFKDKNFWEEFLCYAINKEIMKTLQRDQKVKEDKENSDYKYSNVVFAQILTLIDNMIEFDLNCDTIKEVLGPKVNVYKLNDTFKETINDVIAAKLEQKDKELQEIEKVKNEEKIKKEENQKKEENKDNEKKES